MYSSSNLPVAVKAVHVNKQASQAKIWQVEKLAGLCD